MTKYSREKYFRAINQRITWSALARFGNSPVAKTTILVPFIGYAVIFNQPVQDFFASVLGASSHSPDASILDFLDSRRLHFLYFGLVIWGIAIGIFGLAAPEDIARHPTVADFVSHQEAIRTESLVSRSLEQVVQQYFRFSRGEHHSVLYHGSPLAMPYEVIEPLHRFAEKLFRSVEDFEFDGDEGASRFHTGSGYVQTEEVLEVLNSRIAVTRAMWSTMYEAAFAESREVFFLEFHTKNFRNVGARWVAAALILAGSVVLLIPTIVTTLAVLRAF